MSTALSSKYWIKWRETKRGKVCDIRFYYINSSGKQAQKSLGGYKTVSAAKLARENFLKTYIEPPKLNAEIIDISFADAVNYYLTVTKNNGQETSYYDRKAIFNKYIIPYFNNIEIHKIKAQNVCAWQDYMRLQTSHNKPIKDGGKPLSQGYIRKAHNYLNCFFTFATPRYGLNNPMNSVEKPPFKKVRNENNYYDTIEFAEFLKVLNDSQDGSFEKLLDKTYFMFLYYTGVRENEATALSDKDVSTNKVKIYRTIIYKTDDGSLYKISGRRKNEKPYNATIPDVLRKQLDVYLAYKTAYNISGQFLFAGERPFSDKTMRNHFYYYVEMANLKRITPHGLRHSYASLLAHLHTPIPIIAKMMGITIEMVAKTYAHFFENDYENTVTMLNKC